MVVLCYTEHDDNIFKPPPPVGAGGGYMFSGRPCRCPSVRASVRPSVIHVVVLCFRDISTLQYLLTDFRQTFVTGVSWDTDDLITFWGQKVKVQGHTIAAEAHSTRRYRTRFLHDGGTVGPITAAVLQTAISGLRQRRL